MRLLLLTIGLFLSANISASIRFTHLFTSYNTTIETNIGVVGVVAEDRLGFIWLGGKNGLARYDGHTLKVYRRRLNDQQSLPGNFIRDIVFDNNGVMWVGTSEGVVEYKPETDTFFRYNLNPDSDSDRVSQDISSLAVDRLNNIIIGTHAGIAVLGPSRIISQKFHNQPKVKNSLSENYVRTIYVDKKNQIWIGTNSSGISVLNLEKKEFIHYKHDSSNPTSLAGNAIRSILEDHEGNIWVGTYGSGVSKLNIGTQDFSNYLLTKVDQGTSGGYVIHNMLRDSRNDIWLATDHGGLAKYNPGEDDFSYFKNDIFDSYSISSNQVRYLFEDSVGDLWVSTFPGGLDFVDRSSSIFRNFSHNPSDPKSLSNSAVLCFFKDSASNLWVGTENGLNLFDVNSASFTSILPDTKKPHALRYGTVLSLNEDRDGSLWIGTWSGGLQKYNVRTKQFTNYSFDPNDPSSISSMYVWSIFIDSRNTLWVGTESGLNRFNRQANTFTAFVEDPNNILAISDNDVRDIIEAPNGDLWVATLGGLDRFKKDKEVFIHYQPDPKNPNAIKGVRITDLLEAEDGRIWIATQDEGLNIYHPNEEKFTHLGIEEGLPSNELSGLLEDDQGNIWVNSSSGLIFIDKNTLEYKHYTKEYGLVGNNFNRSASFKDEFGNLYFGSTEGISIFHPSQLLSTKKISPIHISGVSSFGARHSFLFDSDNSTNYQSLLHKNELTLNHTITGFTFDFSLLSYRSSNKNSYAYQLEGFENDWHYVGSKHEATYTNIAPGKYLFKVKAANRDGFWMPEGDSIHLNVIPAPWLAWWAITAYGLLFVIFFMSMFRIRNKGMVHPDTASVNQKLVRVGKIKDAILVNTSQEFRAPLNSIVAITESLVDGIAGDLNPAAKDYLDIVSKNGKKLTQLVDNILDYASLIDDEGKVISRPVDIYSVIQTIISSYPDSHGISLLNTVSRAAPMILADEDRLLQIFKNLVDCAVAFTVKGTITVSCEEQGTMLKVSVTDASCGMNENQLEQLFNPFCVTEGADSAQLSGIGLGLAISKHLVELHGGRVEVKPEVGKGNCFSVILPFEEHYTVETLPILAKQPLQELIEKKAHEPQFQEFSLYTNGLDQALKEALPQSRKYTIMVVDDDAVNRMVLTSMLSQYQFSTIESESGQVALDIFHTMGSTIDIIIMDVMMPGMTGYEACRSIRETCSMFQLPIVFLTSKRVPFSPAEGFLAGGNDFISKPVSKYELIPRVLNIIKMIETKKTILR